MTLYETETMPGLASREPMRPSLAIIIVSFNTRRETLECIAAVDRACEQRLPHVIVVDNGSADGSADAIEERFPQVEVIRAGENLGFARAVNLGVAASGDDFVLLLNPDTVPLPGSIARLLAFAAEHPEFGLFGGRTVDRAGVLDPSSCWGSPTLWSLSCFATGLSTAFAGNRLLDPESLGRWPRDTIREVPIVTGCLLLVQRRDFLALGGLDPRFFLYGEDAEFSMRARERGLRAVIVPEATIVHAVGSSTGDRSRKMSMVLAGKTTLLRVRWPRMRAAVGIGMLQLGTALRGGLEVLTRREEKMWLGAWRRRRDWRVGYPEAEYTLFGRARP